MPGERVIVTAAVKSRALLEAAVRAGATVSLDNADELADVVTVAASVGSRAHVALRLASSDPAIPPTRFGMVSRQWDSALASASLTDVSIEGIHFHLNAYSAEERAATLREALPWADALREAGHDVGFIDIGGGIPMSLPRGSCPVAGVLGEARAGRARDAHVARRPAGSGGSVGVQTLTLGISVLAAQGPRTVDARRVASPRPGAQDPRGGDRGARAGATVRAGQVGARRLRDDARGGGVPQSDERRDCARGAAHEPHAGEVDVGRFHGRPALGAAVRGGEASPAFDGFLVGAYCVEDEAHPAQALAFPRRRGARRYRCIRQHGRLPDAHPRKRLPPTAARCHRGARGRRLGAGRDRRRGRGGPGERLA
ncbi:hypothetical protein [Demequina litorisediminis]|uniref:hypothetical protein n=1 Tax=Demequina litorisediminis TaxID=1849022 RepID=UPI0024E11E00|nr:hypothetical protein [Demequina litorisediminis]